MDREEAPSRDQRTSGDSESTSSVGQLGHDTRQVRLNLDEVLDILGWVDGEHTAMCHRPVGGQFASSVVKSVDASSFLATLQDEECVWFSVNPTAGPRRHNQGRGNERAVSRWAGIPLDLDVKDGAFTSLQKAAEFVEVLSQMIGARPTIVITSGHGLQPIWAIEKGELDDEVKWSRAYRLVRRFGRLAASAAKNHCGAELDNISDLSRVLRVPETRNWKDPRHPAEVFATCGGGVPLADMDCVEEVLDEWGVEIESDSPVSGEILSAPNGWQFGTTNCRYAIEMVVRWDRESDRPKAGRHQWAMNRAVRLASAYRLGCVTQDGLIASLEHLETALMHWCHNVGDPRPLHQDEVGSAFRWAQNKVATFTDERVRVELGQHTHGESCATAGRNRADFWELTDTLRHVRDFARARRVSPWAMLGAVLVNVIGAVPPSVQIPPLVGSRASLNLFVGLVGESGKGKGAPERAAKDAVRTKPIYSTGIGSGEGINHMFAHYDKQADTTVMDRDTVLFSVPEIDTLAALGQRNASTLLPQLRKAWSGEALSFAYAARDKGLVIREHSYRLVLVAGIQPGRAGALLDDVDGGTPQRFVWLPCADPDAPEKTPSQPEPIDRTGIAEGWSRGGRADLGAMLTPHEIDLPDEAKRLVDRARLAVLRGESTDSALDGHLLLCRIKVAIALALLHDCRKVTTQFWEMSEEVMAVSQATRRGVQAELAQRTEQLNRARGRAEGIRAVEADTIREDEAIKRVTQAILRALRKLGGSAAKSAVYEKVAHRDRSFFDAALDQLVCAGQVDVSEVGRGVVLKLTGSS